MHSRQDAVRYLSAVPNAVCVVHNDADFTIDYANERFYDLLKSTKEEVSYRFGNRSSAIFGARLTKQLRTRLESERTPMQFSLEGKLFKKEDCWLMAQFDISLLSQSNRFFISFIDITVYKNMEARLKLYQKNLDYVNEIGNFDILEYDVKTGYIQELFCKHYDLKGLNRKRSFDKELLEKKIIHNDYHDIFMNSLNRLGEHQKRVICDVKMRTLQHGYKWVRISLSYHNNGQHSYVLCLITDYQAEKETSAKYLQESMYYQSILSDQSAFAHIDITDNRVERLGGIWNAFRDLCDKKTFTDIFEHYVTKVVHRDDQNAYLSIIHIDTLLEAYENGNTHMECEFRRILKQNKLTWMMLSVHVMEDPVTKHIKALFYTKDIDTIKRQRNEAECDKLTKVYNRLTLESQIVAALKASSSQEISLFGIIDIDNFHKVNDEFGYRKGDEVLINLVNIFKDTFRNNDIIGRYGGDQFILFLKNIKNTDLINARMKELFERIKQFKDPQISCSAGLVYVNNHETYESCFQMSNEALFHAKQKHRGTYRFFQYQVDESPLQMNQSPDFERFLVKQKLLASAAINQYRNEIDRLVGDEGDMAYLIDPRNYELICGNNAFYERIGLSEEECRGLKCHQILYKRDTPCTFCRKANWNPDSFNQYHNYNDVLAQDFLIKNKLVTWGGSQMLMAMAIDISGANIVDTVEQDTSEEHYILSTIQNIQSAATFVEMQQTILDAVGTFFRADVVRLWQHHESAFEPILGWVTKPQKKPLIKLDKEEIHTVSSWLITQENIEVINIESREKMLTKNFSLYNFMLKRDYFNQRWVTLRNHKGETIAIIEIENINQGFDNKSFMASLSSFLVNEWTTRKIMDQMKYQNDHDGLTGLMNRSSYEILMKNYEEDEVKSTAVIAINVNRLGKLNQQFGVTYGDECLGRLSKYMQDTFKSEHVFRLSGDEFQVIIFNEAVPIIEKQITKLKKLIKTDGQFTISIGYAWDNIEKKMNDLINYAEQSMKLAKKRFYDQINDRHANDRLEMQTNLLKSLDNHEFEVFLQAKVNANNDALVGAEALIRYRNQNGEIIPPSQYIGNLEKNNLIRYIDLFVFEEVCRILDKWGKQGITLPCVSLNFSRMTLMEEGLIEIMDIILKKYHVAKDKIQVEITESYADVGKTLLYRAASRIHQSGYSLALDDFGTSYTNLSILSDIHVDVLKLDKSLIHSLSVQSKNRVIVKNVVQMCHDLNIEVIAEGVETEEQRAILLNLGCHLIQGYLYSKPIDCSSFEETFLMKSMG